MTNKKSLKRALILNVLSTLLCVSMLLGTTFAWFTDTVESGVNQIVAGNLDVELTHKSASVTTAESVEGKTNLFQIAKWEPGVYTYEVFTVKNVGDLALVYQLSILASNVNYVVTPDGQKTENSLLTALYVKEIAGDNAPDTRPTYSAADGTRLDAYLDGNSVKSEDLEPDASTTTTIIIYWPQSEADNQWNLQNGKYASDATAQTVGRLKVDLAIRLVATQHTSESDSFDDQYDAQAHMHRYSIQNDGSWICNGVGGDVPCNEHIYENTDAPYVMILGEEGFNQPTIAIPLTGAHTDELADVGVTISGDTITYANNDAAQNVVIRTNGGTLTIDAANDTVSHYGFATVVNCNDVKVGTYNENGTVGRLIYSDNEGKIYFGATAVVYCYMNTSSDVNADLDDEIKHTSAVVYTNVNHEHNASVYKNKTVTVNEGLVEISSCANHNEDYAIVKIRDTTYVICKCCGAFSKYSADNDGHLVTELGEGIDESNSFGIENSELGLDIVEEPDYIIYTSVWNGESWIDLYFTSLEEAFAASKESEDAGGGYLELHLLCDLEVNTIFALAEVGDSYASEIYLDGYTLSGDLFLNGTTLSLYDGTVTANIYLNDTTKGNTTQNCALNLGTEWEDDNGTYNPVISTGLIILNGEESSLALNIGSSASSVTNNGGTITDYNNN